MLWHWDFVYFINTRLNNNNVVRIFQQNHLLSKMGAYNFLLIKMKCSKHAQLL